MRLKDIHIDIGKKLGIKGLGFSSYKLWTIPICPRPVVIYQLGGRTWKE